MNQINRNNKITNHLEDIKIIEEENLEVKKKIKELKLDLESKTHFYVKKYKFYMNYYHDGIKDIKVEIYILKKNINTLESELENNTWFHSEIKQDKNKLTIVREIIKILFGNRNDSPTPAT